MPQVLIELNFYAEVKSYERLKVEDNNQYNHKKVYNCNYYALENYDFVPEPPIPKTDIVHARVTKLVANICDFPFQ